MNKWFKLALFAFIGIIVLNLLLSLFGGRGFSPYGGSMYNAPGYYNNHMQNMPMNRGTGPMM